MRLKLLHSRSPLGTAFMTVAAFLAGLGSAHGFVTDNKTVTTFDAAGAKKADAVKVSVAYTTISSETLPTAYVINTSSGGGTPNLLSQGNVGADASFLASARDVQKGKSWELGIQYVNSGDIDSISTITFAVGTFTINGQAGNWYSGDLGTNVMFTATINTITGGTIGTDGKITGGTQVTLGTLVGYLYDPKTTTSDMWKGSGSDKITTTLTPVAGEAITLSGYDNYSVQISASFVGTPTVTGLGVGFGSIEYQSESTVDGFIWRGTDTDHNWNGSSNDWDKIATDSKTGKETITSNEIFQLGYNAIFDGKDNNHEVVFNTQTGITASQILITTGEYTFNMQNGAAPTAKVLNLQSDTSRLNLTGEDKTMAVDSVAGKGTIGKTGEGKTTLKASKEKNAASGAFTEFSGNIVVDKGILEIQSATQLSVKDVILDGGELVLRNTLEAVGWQRMEVKGTLKGGAEGTGASGNITLASGAVLDASDAAGQGGIDLNGNITLSYGVELSQKDIGIFVPGVLPGETYDLLTVTGTLYLTDEEGNTIDAATLAEGYDAARLFKNITAGYFDLRYRSSSTGDGVGTFYLYTVVPEPATGTMTLLALAAISTRRRRLPNRGSRKS